MAARVAMRSIYQSSGFSLEAAGLSVDDQDTDTLEELSILKYEDCESLYKLVRRPGVTILNPNMAVDGAPVRILNSGLVVPMRAVTNLKLTCFNVHHKERTSRVFAPVNLTFANVRTLNLTFPPSRWPNGTKHWSKLTYGLLPMRTSSVLRMVFL